MTPTIGSKWLARDGREMIVEEVLKFHDFTAVNLRVLNATGRMRKQTSINSKYFGTIGKFLRPAEVAA